MVRLYLVHLTLSPEEIADNSGLIGANDRKGVRRGGRRGGWPGFRDLITGASGTQLVRCLHLPRHTEEGATICAPLPDPPGEGHDTAQVLDERAEQFKEFNAAEPKVITFRAAPFPLDTCCLVTTDQLLDSYSMCSLEFSSNLKSYIDAIIPTDSPEDPTIVAVVEDTDEVISEEERASQVWAE
jgi:hypothetical protein